MLSDIHKGIEIDPYFSVEIKWARSQIKGQRCAPSLHVNAVVFPSECGVLGNVGRDLNRDSYPEARTVDVKTAGG